MTTAADPVMLYFVGYFLIRAGAPAGGPDCPLLEWARVCEHMTIEDREDILLALQRLAQLGQDHSRLMAPSSASSRSA